MIIKTFCLRRRFFFDKTGGFKDGEKGNHKSKVKSPPMAGDSHQTIEAFLAEQDKPETFHCLKRLIRWVRRNQPITYYTFRM